MSSDPSPRWSTPRDSPEMRLYSSLPRGQDIRNYPSLTSHQNKSRNERPPSPNKLGILTRRTHSEDVYTEYDQKLEKNMNVSEIKSRHNEADWEQEEIKINLDENSTVIAEGIYPEENISACKNNTISKNKISEIIIDGRTKAIDKTDTKKLMEDQVNKTFNNNTENNIVRDFQGNNNLKDDTENKFDNGNKMTESNNAETKKEPERDPVTGRIIRVNPLIKYASERKDSYPRKKKLQHSKTEEKDTNFNDEKLSHLHYDTIKLEEIKCKSEDAESTLKNKNGSLTENIKVQIKPTIEKRVSFGHCDRSSENLGKNKVRKKENLRHAQSLSEGCSRKISIFKVTTHSTRLNLYIYYHNIIAI